MWNAIRQYGTLDPLVLRYVRFENTTFLMVFAHR